MIAHIALQAPSVVVPPLRMPLMLASDILMVPQLLDDPIQCVCADTNACVWSDLVVHGLLGNGK